MMRISLVTVMLAAALVGTACTNSNKSQPVVASSSGETGYATRFPSEVSSTREDLSEAETKAKENEGKFANYPGELKEPGWSHVLTVYEKADAEGQNASYVDAYREGRTVTKFYDEEKDEIAKRVAGAAEYTASQKGCAKSGAGGAAMGALDKSIEERLEKRLRANSEAHAYIEENQEALGKENVEKLEDQADDIAETSYLVKVEMVEAKARLKALVEESKQVKNTLDRSAKDAQAVLDDASRGEEDKKAAQKKLDAVKKAQAEIDNEVTQAETQLKELDERLKAAKAEYEKAFGDLKKAVEEKAKEEKGKAKAEKKS